MKNPLKVLVLALTTLAFAGVGFAADKPMEKMDKPAEKKMEAKPEKPKATRITGEVTAVDAKAGTLTVKTKNKDVNLTADKGALGKVKVGDTVRVSYTEKDGKMVASSVTGVKGTEKKADTAMDKSKAMEKPEKKAEEKKAATK